ncbi:hypothetical protein, partial [Thiolapillus sp.]
NSNDSWVQFVTGKILPYIRISNCIISDYKGFAFLFGEISGLAGFPRLSKPARMTTNTTSAPIATGGIMQDGNGIPSTTLAVPPSLGQNCRGTTLLRGSFNRMLKSPSLDFFNHGTGKCDFPVPSFSMAYGH